MYTLGKDFDTTEAKEFVPFENPPSGGYVFKVVGSEDAPTRGGRPMVTLALDIDEGPHKGAFTRFPKPYRQMLDGESLPYFKAMLKYFGESNPEAKMQKVIFTQRDGSKGFDHAALVGLRIGGNLREAEYIKQDTGETKVGLEVSFLGAVKDVGSMKPLPLKKLEGSRPAARPAASRPATTSRPPLDEDDSLPF
jgi:hypothetical protein